MQGGSKYVAPDSNGNSPVVENLTAGSRMDYVLTRCRKSDFDIYTVYKLQNDVTATVIPTDRKDSPTSADNSAIGIYEKIKPSDPVYHNPGESYRISKYGIYGDKKIVTSDKNIYSYNLDRLVNGQSLPGIMYYIEASVNAYAKTLADGATGTEQDAIDNKFGQKDVRYSISDSEIHLGNSAVPLNKDDYTFTSLEYSVKMQGASYDQEIKGFVPYNITQYSQNDILTFYVMTGEDDGYRKAATYDLSTNTANIADSSIYSLTNSSVTFNGDVKGWKIETSNPYYSTAFKIYPTITLNSTDTVRDAIPNTDAAKISVKNSSTLDVEDSSANTITRSDTGTDYIANVERKSNISKKAVSAKSYPGIRAYKVNWEISMSETYTDDLGINPVKQESGVFYDLIPLGCRVDLSSIKVYIDGNNVELPESEYTVEALEENYKNTNRTLLTVRISSPSAEGKYRMTYTTVHLWEDVLDFGRYIMNSVAYETGNQDIAGGYPDNGGSISDSTIMTNLDPETNDKRFIYSQATHSINALIPISSGISKKVASSNDALFVDKTVVNQDSTYVYKIRMENSSHSTSRNIIIFDSLENFCGDQNGSANGRKCDWHGTLESFGLNHLKELGIDPKVYLSNVPNLNLEGAYTANQAGEIHLESDPNWKLIDDFIDDFGDVSKATAFAIDLSTRTDGDLFELGENRSFSFTVTMRSPQTVDDIKKLSLETYNNIYRSFISKDTELQSESKYYDHQDYTTVVYRVVGDMKFQKLDSETSEPIQGIQFNISGTSFYGTVVDKNVTSDANGIVYLANLERGTYLLTETDPTVDYLTGQERIVTVDTLGKVTFFPADGNNGEVPVIKNQPRIHGDLTFLKRDYFNLDKPLTGAVFSLTGISYYGNAIKKTAVSTSSGVAFEDVEMGYNYTLKEISAPDGFITESREYKVICDAAGVLSIPELSLNSSGDYVITNKPSTSFTLKKVDAVNNEPLSGAHFTLTSDSTDSGITINRTVISNQFGEVKFEDLDYGTYHLEETTPPDKHKANEKGYSVDIQLVNNKTVITIKDLDTDKELDLNDDGEFVVSNEREYKRKITIIKKWVGDDENTRPTDPPVIHLSTEEPEYVSYTATINISLLKKYLLTDAVSFQRDTTSSLADIKIKLDNKTAIEIGTATGETPKEKPVYLYNVGNDYYYWSEAEKIYLGDGESAQNLFCPNKNTTSSYSSLATIDISGLDTSKVTNFNDAFKGLTALTYLNVGDLELDGVTTSLAGMFYYCKNLTKIDGKFGAGKNVKEINGMFRECNKLESVDLSEFETSDTLTKANQMFQNCNKLAYVDLSKLNTSKVTDMNNMFINCNSLASIDVSNFDTSEVTNMSYMFSHCTVLKSIDLSNFNTTNVKDINRMFDSCTSITSITLGENFTLESVKGIGDSSSAAYMFTACSALTTIDISSFGTVTTDVRGMFKDCKSLTTIYATENVNFTNAREGTGENQMFGYKPSNNAPLNYLVGGSNTRWDSKPNINGDYRSKVYARIDGGAAAPGYFTRKPEAIESQSVISFNIAAVSDTTNDIMLLANDTDINLPADSDSTETGNTVTENYVSTDKKQCTITKNGDTWIYEFNVYDDEALYYVYEEVPDGYISDATVNKPKKVNDGSLTKRQTITNTKKDAPKLEYGNLTISKKVTNSDIPVTDDTTLFTFRITLSGEKITEDQHFGAYEFVYDTVTEKATAEVTLKSGEQVEIEGIPAGTDYEIEETELYGYTSVPPDNASGTITKDTTSEVKWVNQADDRETGAVHVSKTVVLHKIIENLDGTTTDLPNAELPDEEKNQKFLFTAVLSNLGGSKEYVIQNGYATQTFTSDSLGNATVTFTLKHGETADFTDIPIGTVYKITEASAENFETAYELSDANGQNHIVTSSGGAETAYETFDSGENVTVAFTNSKTIREKENVKTISITAEKLWKNDTEADRPKSITVYLERYLSGFPNTAEVVDTATITLHNSEWKTVFSNFPQTDEQGRAYVYSVCEESVAGYTCSVALTSTDPATGNQQFTITNKKDPTYDLTVHKTVEGAFGNKAKQFEFTVTLKDGSGKPLNGFYTLQRGEGEVLVLFDVNGQAKIGVAHDEDVVIKNLPQGTQFTVTETDYSKEGYIVRSGIDDDELTENSRISDTLNDNKTAYFVNSRTGVLPTGIETALMLFAVPGILSLGVLMFIRRKKRKSHRETIEN